MRFGTELFSDFYFNENAYMILANLRSVAILIKQTNVFGFIKQFGSFTHVIFLFPIGYEQDALSRQSSKT